FVGRAGAILVERILTRLKIVGDLRQALVRGFLGQRLDGKRRSRQIIEQRLEPLMKQRQPVLHAGVAAAFADRLVEHVGRGGGARPRSAPNRRGKKGGWVSLVSETRAMGTRSGARNPPLVRGLWGSKLGIVPKVPPKKPSRTGASMPGANRSTMPPRTA